MAAIAELTPDRVVEGVYAVARKQRLTTRSGAPYLALELVDPSGRIEGRVWQDVELLDGRFDEGDAVRVLGRVERFRDRLQLDVRTLEAAPETNRRRAHARDAPGRRGAGRLPRLPRRRDRAPGARGRSSNGRSTRRFESGSGRCRPTIDGHHSYAGGLLEHTVGVATICRETAQLHPRLRGDLLLAAALLHDVGRTLELGRAPTFRPTTEGALLGHVHLGLRLVEERAGGARSDGRAELLHAIASHHEVRAARTAEAAVLYHANQLDAVAATRPVDRRVTAIALALAASVSWGVGDFLGGVASRRLATLTVLAVSEVAGLVLLGVLVAAGGDEPLGAGATAAARRGGGRRGRRPRRAVPGHGRGRDRRRRAGVDARRGDPARRTASRSGERPGALQLVGAVAILAGVALVSREPGPAGARVAAGVGFALLAAAGFGLYFVFIDAASEASAPWAVFVARAVASAARGDARPLPRRPARPGAALPWLVAIGAFDATANGLLAAALNRGYTSIVAVVASLYPVVTVLLATTVLRERVAPLRAVGIGAALVGVACVSVG